MLGEVERLRGIARANEGIGFGFAAQISFAFVERSVEFFLRLVKIGQRVGLVGLGGFGFGFFQGGVGFAHPFLGVAQVS